jgi:hypothetical protein
MEKTPRVFWPDLTFPPINLWNVPLMSMARETAVMRNSCVTEMKRTHALRRDANIAIQRLMMCR